MLYYDRIVTLTLILFLLYSIEGQIDGLGLCLVVMVYIILTSGAPKVEEAACSFDILTSYDRPSVKPL